MSIPYTYTKNVGVNECYVSGPNTTVYTTMTTVPRTVLIGVGGTVCTVVGFADNCFENTIFTNANFGDLSNGPLSQIYGNIKYIGIQAFESAQFTGAFPALPLLTSIGIGAFSTAQFTGAFPALPALQTIGFEAFSNTFDGGSPFTSISGAPNTFMAGVSSSALVTIDAGAFSNAQFSGAFPALPLLQTIGSRAFPSALFTGAFPALPLLQTIGTRAFPSALFTGAFPALPALQTIGSNAFSTYGLVGVPQTGSPFTSVAGAPNTFMAGVPSSVLTSIGADAFYYALFTGAFPALPLLTIGANAFFSANFDAPTITTLNPTGVVGSYTLYCTGLVDTSAGAVGVSFGGVPVSNPTYKNDYIVFTIPAQVTPTFTITVTAGGKVSSPVTFTYQTVFAYSFKSVPGTSPQCYVSGPGGISPGVNMPVVPATVVVGSTPYTVVGFADNCLVNNVFTNANFGDLSIGPLSLIYSNIKYIGSQAFSSAQFTGAFPALPLLQTIGTDAFQFAPFTSVAGAPNTFMAGGSSLALVSIGSQAFRAALFTGAFPALPALQTIGIGAFPSALFTGAFPALPLLQTIGNQAFFIPATAIGSLFSATDGTNTFMAGVSSSALVTIGSQAFGAAQFTGAFPALPLLQDIGFSAFRAALFTGAFPALPVLAQTVPSVFTLSSTFDPPTITTVNPAGSSGTSFTLYCTGVVDIDTRTVSATFGAGALTLSSYTNNKIVFTIPPGTGTSSITVKVGTAASAPVTFTYIQPIEYTYIAQNTTECYVSGATNVQSGFSYSMPPVPATVLIGGTVCNVVGFADNCFQNIIFTNANFGDLSNGPLSQIYGNIKYIGNQAFQYAEFTGAFPALPALQTIDSGAFFSAPFTGAFPALTALQTIGENAFNSAQFTGAFPALPLLTSIGGGAFGNGLGGGSPFTSISGAPNTFMAGVSSSMLTSIGVSAFSNAQFTGAFPVLNALETIGSYAFSNAQFSGAFPALPLLTIGANAFFSANFDAPTITTLNPTGVVGSYTLYCTGLVDTSAGAVGVSFGGVPVSNPTYKNDYIVFTIPAQVTPTFTITVTAGGKVSSPVTFTYQTVFAYSFTSVPGTSPQCYVSGSGGISPSPAGDMPTVPATVLFGSTPYTVVGFADNCLVNNVFTNANFGDLSIGPLSLIYNNIKYIGSQAFSNAQFTGAFPALPALQTIGNNAFYNTATAIGSTFSATDGTNTFMAGVSSSALVSIGNGAFSIAQFTGAFPALPALQTIGSAAFSIAQFTGAFPALPLLQTIGANAFSNFGIMSIPSTTTGSPFTSVAGAPNTFMAGVSSSALVLIGGNAFYNAQFSGAFPALPLLQTIGPRAFSNAQFTGAFPALPLLQTIGDNAFSTYRFFNVPQTGSPFTSVAGAPNTFMAGVSSSALVDIGNQAFYYALFTGAFPALTALQTIGQYAFSNAQFTGAFPVLTTLDKTVTNTFQLSTFNAPTITTLNPTGDAQSSCTLYCTGLVDTNAGGVSAAFGAIDPLSITYTNNKIVFTVPAQTVNPVPITVRAGGNTSTPAVLFTYPTPPSPPGPPLNPGATGGDTTIALSWTAPSTGGAVQSYYYSIDGGSNKVQVPGSTSSTTSYTIPGLTNGTFYPCIIYAYNSQGFSDPSTAVPATPNPTVVPNAPTLTTGSCTAGNTTITLVWAAPSTIPPSVSNYAYSATISGDPVVKVPIGNVLTYTVQGLTNGVSYVCKVYAQNTIGYSQASATFTGMPATNPDPPTNVHAIAENASATVSWTAPANTGASNITSYTVTSNPLVTPQTTTTGTTLSYPGLTNGTSYTFTVRATNNANLTSDASTASAGVTPATNPGPPTGVQGTSGNASATVSWTAPVNTGASSITSYTVTSNPLVTPQTTTTGTSLIYTGLTNGTPYTFTVRATNNAGFTSDASTASAGVTPATNPGPPTGVHAIAGNASATVSWTAPANTGASSITSYTVTSNPLASPQTTTGTTLSYPGLTNGTPYTFTVTATNNANLTSVASTASAGVTPSTVPGAPTGATATAGNISAVVSWTPPVNTGGAPITSYTITNNRNIDTYSPTNSPFTVPNLLSTTSYTFSITANNINGPSLAAATTNAVTPNPAAYPSAPLNVLATAGNASAEVSWTAPLSTGATSITSYTVTSVPPVGGSHTVAGTLLSYNYGALTNGTAYTFSVTATNNGGLTSPAGTSESVTPVEVEVPTEYVIQISSFNVFGTNFRGMGNLGDYY